MDSNARKETQWDGREARASRRGSGLAVSFVALVLLFVGFSVGLSIYFGGRGKGPEHMGTMFLGIAVLGGASGLAVVAAIVALVRGERPLVIPLAVLIIPLVLLIAVWTRLLTV